MNLTITVPTSADDTLCHYYCPYLDGLYCELFRSMLVERERDTDDFGDVMRCEECRKAEG